MLYMSYTQKSKLKGTIKFSKDRDPMYFGLGIYTDIHGQKWDIKAIMRGYVCAVKKENLHPYYNDTSDFRTYGMVRQTWEPYQVEIV